MKSLKRIMLVALAAMALTMTGMTEAQAATKKPGTVTHLSETKVTHSSISIRFNKAKRAKKYEVRVYAARRSRASKAYLAKLPSSYDKPWAKYSIKTTKKLVAKLDTKKTKCTIKGLPEGEIFTVKVRAVNGNKKGKWTTQFMETVLNEKDRVNVHLPGSTSAEGKYLEKQYENWKKHVTEHGGARGDNYSLCSDLFSGCVKVETSYRQTDPNNYTKADLLRLYKRGFWTDVEAYQIIKDVMEDSGVPCRIMKGIEWYMAPSSYEGEDVVYGSNGDKYTLLDNERYMLMDLKNHKYVYIKPGRSVSGDTSPEWYYELNPNCIWPQR